MTNQIAAVESLRSRVLRVLKERPPENPYQDVVDLFDNPDIREVCNDRNKLAIILSDMFRAKIVTRAPATRTGSPIRFAYGSLAVVGARVAKANQEAEAPKKEVTVTPKKDKITPSAKVKAKPNIRVTEHTVTIETESVRIVVELY